MIFHDNYNFVKKRFKNAHTKKDAKLFQVIYEYETFYIIFAMENPLQGAGLVRMDYFPGILKVFIFIKITPGSWL